jgi:hypothetical protein
MQLSDRPITIANPTLNTLITELGAECCNVSTLINQLQLPHLTVAQQTEILAELLAATVHLHTHCDEELQDLIADEMENLPDEQD